MWRGRVWYDELYIRRYPPIKVRSLALKNHDCRLAFNFEILRRHLHCSGCVVSKKISSMALLDVLPSVVCSFTSFYLSPR